MAYQQSLACPNHGRRCGRFRRCLHSSAAEPLHRRHNMDRNDWRTLLTWPAVTHHSFGRIKHYYSNRVNACTLEWQIECRHLHLYICRHGGCRDNRTYTICHYTTREDWRRKQRRRSGQISSAGHIRRFIQAYTEYETQEVIAEGVNGTNVTTTQITGKSVGMTSGTNLLGIVVFCIALGLSMSTDRESSKPLLDFMLALRSNIFKIFTVYIWSLPVATASLIAASLLRVDDIYGIWASLGLFAATVIIGLALHEFLWMPLAYFISTRNNPFTVYYKCGKAIFTAVVSRSSAATLPVLFKCCEVGLRFHKRVCSFVLPISMFKGDGSALFIICSCIWLGQRSEMGLAAGQIVLMGVLTVFLTFCLPAVPSASLVGIVLICESANVPSEEVGLLISMEWLLDALRTVVNVSSHGICAGLGNHFMEGAFNLDDEDEESGFDDRSSDQPEKRGNCDENIKLMDGNGKELGESGSDTKL
ncbi:excitatory amino acid transporter 3-like isoform X2 [Ptychodera flava]|uniref:excitatory amino acid transporter 3-like isoform X2 n=1 Tax=Ptychodera flava TaxID=63121 RepID=UPI00396A7E3C